MLRASSVYDMKCITKGLRENFVLAYFLTVKTVENSGDMWITDNRSIELTVLAIISIF